MVQIFLWPTDSCSGCVTAALSVECAGAANALTPHHAVYMLHSLEHIVEADPEHALVPVDVLRGRMREHGGARDVSPARAAGGPGSPPRVVSPRVAQAQQAGGRVRRTGAHFHHVEDGVRVSGPKAETLIFFFIHLIE